MGVWCRKPDELPVRNWDLRVCTCGSGQRPAAGWRGHDNKTEGSVWDEEFSAWLRHARGTLICRVSYVLLYAIQYRKMLIASLKSRWQVDIWEVWLVVHKTGTSTVRRCDTHRPSGGRPFMLAQLRDRPALYLVTKLVTSRTTWLVENRKWGRNATV